MKIEHGESPAINPVPVLVNSTWKSKGTIVFPASIRYITETKLILYLGVKTGEGQNPNTTHFDNGLKSKDNIFPAGYHLR